MPKAKRAASSVRHTAPFETSLSEAATRAARPRASFAAADDNDDDDGGGGESGSVPARLSRRILEAAREQLDEAGSDEGDVGGGGRRRVRFGSAAPTSAGVAATAFAARGARGAWAPGSGGGGGGDDDDDDEGGAGDDEALDLGGAGAALLRTGAGDFVDAEPDFEVSGAEAALLSRFMPEEASQRRTLADVIMEKLAARGGVGGGDGGSAAGGGGGGAPAAGAGAPPGAPALDARVLEAYTEVGRFLASYKQGKVPKVFKVIPSLPNWEEVLFLTNPETWTPHATYAATRIFVSNLTEAKAQRFNALVLLPKCRDDIFAHKRLNFHLYLALRKATFKSGAFFRGLLLPLAAGGDCTLREALIIGSVVAKASIPQIHAAAAMMKLAAMPYSGAVSIFLRQLLNKKYTLPYVALDAVAAHFADFAGVPGPLPVIWHQALLAMVQRYRGEFTEAQRGAIEALLRTHGHAGIGPEVRRELAAGGTRGATTAAAVPVGSAAAAAVAAAEAAAAAAAAGRRGGSHPQRKGRGAGETMAEY